MSDTAELRLLEETAEQIFAAHAGEEHEPGTFSTGLWADLEQSGLTLLGIGEKAGGSGGGLTEAAVLLRAAGAASVPVPLAETLLAAAALEAAGLAVPAGVLTAAAGGRAVRDGDTWLISGTLRRVPWVRAAAGLVVLADGPDGPVTALVDPARAELTHGQNVAGEPRDDVGLDGVRPVACAPGGASEALRARAALARAVQLSGAAATALRLSLRYTSERIQFGRPLAKFQAVQHRLSEMAGETALTDIAVRAAVAATERAAAEPGNQSLAANAEVAVAAAKSQASLAAGRVAAGAHQLHGAIGATHEHELRHTTLRLWSWREEAGAESPWNEELAARAVTATSLWCLITGTE